MLIPRGIIKLVAATGALAALLGMTGPSAAQQIPGTEERIPGTVVPGRPETPVAPLPKKPVELEWTVILPGGTDVPASLAQEKIDFADLKLTGVTVYGLEELAGLFAEYRGQEITFGQLYGFARAIQARYQGDGYLLSFAYVPPQRVKDGVYTIAVVEGFVDRILVEDVEGRLKGTLERQLAPVTQERPLRAPTLERYMLLANDLAGITAAGVLQPAEQAPGASDLVIKVTHVPVNAGISFDNRGSKFEGPLRLAADARVNSLLGLGERFFASASTTPAQPKELKAIDLGFLQPLGDEGIRVSGRAGYTRSEPGFTLSEFDILTTGITADFDVSYPLLRSRARNLTLTAGFSFSNTDVNLLDADFTEDRIRTLRGMATYSDTTLLNGITGTRIQITQGLPILNASDSDRDDMSRSDAVQAFTKLDFSLARAQPLFAGFTLTGSATGQYSFDPLPASEEFAAGGPRFGRGYDLAEVTGEHGLAAALELSYDLRPDTPWVELIRPYVFYDIGKAWDKDTSDSEGLAESLASAGLGIQVTLPYRIALGLEYARPLTRASLSDSDKDGRVFFTLTAGF
ncbi:MAG: ShlB/FhaC/HecB family hemolysin secretion/activation protein [Kiloniellales bacterium]